MFSILTSRILIAVCFHGETRDEQSVLNFVVESSELKLEPAANQAGYLVPSALETHVSAFCRKFQRHSERCG